MTKLSERTKLELAYNYNSTHPDAETNRTSCLTSPQRSPTWPSSNRTLETSPRYHHFLHALARVTARADTDDLRAQWHSPTVQRSRFQSGHDGLHYLSVMDNSLRYDKRKRTLRVKPPSHQQLDLRPRRPPPRSPPGNDTITVDPP